MKQLVLYCLAGFLSILVYEAVISSGDKGYTDYNRFQSFSLSDDLTMVSDSYTGHSYLFIEGTGGVWLRPTSEEMYK